MPKTCVLDLNIIVSQQRCVWFGILWLCNLRPHQTYPKWRMQLVKCGVNPISALTQPGCRQLMPAADVRRFVQTFRRSWHRLWLVRGESFSVTLKSWCSMTYFHMFPYISHIPRYVARNWFINQAFTKIYLWHPVNHWTHRDLSPSIFRKQKKSSRA